MKKQKTEKKQTKSKSFVARLIKDRNQTLYLDEVGRGPLAGPVTVGCVFQTSSTSAFERFLATAKDSKQLTEKQREEIVKVGASHMKQYWCGLGRESAQYIDKYGIIKSLQHASLKAIFQALYNAGVLSQKKYSLSALRNFLQTNKTRKIVMDGNHDFGLGKTLGITVHTIIKGDALISQISLASIHAKVARDQYMTKQSQQFPLYAFEKHKGYGTLSHRTAIQKYGMCVLHRKSYCGRLPRLLGEGWGED